MKMFEVGGCVRDEILGLPSKDIDFSVVLDMQDMLDIEVHKSTPFEWMVGTLRMQGFKVFVETPEFLTVRAQFPKNSPHYEVTPYPQYPASKPLTADFVLARKESDYTDGRRPDKVEPGDLLDDLRRRDFTMNAIAKMDNGEYIDHFNGVRDINDRIIRAVGDPLARLEEDALRAVRALRFSVTKGFKIERALSFCMQAQSVLDAIAGTRISDERIKDELSKMFRFDTVASVIALNNYPALTRAMFAGSVSLDSTMKTKSRGLGKFPEPSIGSKEYRAKYIEDLKTKGRNK